MCYLSMLDIEDETSAIAQAMALRAKQLSNRRSAINPYSAEDYKISPRSSLSVISTARDHCVRGWWYETLCNTAKEFNAQASSFSSHLNSLRNAQKRMHRLARMCTQTRLYPNPASANSKSALKAQLDTLVADMDFAVRRHDVYSAALPIYTFSVQAIIDDLNVPNKKCHCPDCTRQGERCMTDTHTEIQLEAKELMYKLLNMSEAFKKLRNDLLKKWVGVGKNGLCQMISALPEQEDLKKKVAVRKYFPRQIREIEEAENRSVRKSTLIGRAVSGDERKGEQKHDSGCETNPKTDS